MGKFIQALKKSAEIKRMYEAEKYTDIIKNIDSESLVKKYSFTGNDILIEAIRKKVDSINVITSALGHKIGDVPIVLYYEHIGHKYVINYINKIGLRAFNQMNTYLNETEDYLDFTPNDQKVIDSYYKAFNTGEPSSNEALWIAEKAFINSMQYEPGLTRRDFEFLIAKKNKDSRFTLKYDADRTDSRYSPAGDMIVMNKDSIIDFNHELTHFVHKRKCFPQTPKEAENILNKVNVNDKSIYKKLEEIAKECIIDDEYIKQRFEDFVKENEGSMIEYRKHLESDFKSFLGTKELLLEILTSPLRSTELVDYVYEAWQNSKKFTLDIQSNRMMLQYVQYRTKAELAFFKKELFSTLYGEFLLLQNLVDAYLNGSLFYYYANNKYYKNVYGISIHSKSYFNDDVNIRFGEILADYIALKKSPNWEPYIICLRDIVGDEFIEILDNYYETLGAMTLKLKKGKK